MRGRRGGGSGRVGRSLNSACGRFSWDVGAIRLEHRTRWVSGCLKLVPGNLKTPAPPTYHHLPL